jgi:outer membrane protein TolC
MKTYKYSPLPVPSKWGKSGAMLCHEESHSFHQFGRIDFQPCKGEILVARGKATKECRPGLDESKIYRPRLNVVQSINPVSDGIGKNMNRPMSQYKDSTPSGLIDLLATFRGFRPRLFKLSPFRTLRQIQITLIIILVFMFGTVSAQTDSLTYYLELAAKNNPTVLQKLAEYEASLQKVPQVGGLPDPELNVGVFLSPMELVAGKQVADFRLMQMFPWFGQLKNAKDEMSLMAKAKFEAFREAKLQVYFDVQQSWNELQKVQQSILISEKNLEILHSLERLSMVKFKAASNGGSSSSGSSVPGGNSLSASAASSGMSTMGGNTGSASIQSSPTMPSSPMSSSVGSGLAEIYRIQMEIGELENSISFQKNQLQTISVRFNGFLNRKPQTAVQLTEKFIADSLGMALTAVSDSMFADSPMLGMLKYEEQSLDARQQMVTKMGFPMVGVGLNYSLIKKDPLAMSPDMNGVDMIMPMVTVTLPIYRKKYRAMQEEVKLQKVATQQGFQATNNSLNTEYYEAMQLYQDAQRRMKLYDNQSDLANKSLNIMMKSFSASGAGLTDLLRIRQQTLEYETKKIEAISDNNTAIAWINRLTACSQIQ